MLITLVTSLGTIHRCIAILFTPFVSRYSLQKIAILVFFIILAEPYIGITPTIHFGTYSLHAHEA